MNSFKNLINRLNKNDLPQKQLHEYYETVLLPGSMKWMKYKSLHLQRGGFDIINSSKTRIQITVHMEGHIHGVSAPL